MFRVMKEYVTNLYIESMVTYLLSPICLVSCSYIEPVTPYNIVSLAEEIMVEKILSHLNHASRISFCNND